MSYQGPVPQEASVKTFRETGRTVVKKGGKEILYKDYIKNKNKDSKDKKKKVDFKSLEKKLVSKSLLKNNKISVKIPERKVDNIWHDKNRFFKSMMEEED